MDYTAYLSQLTLAWLEARRALLADPITLNELTASIGGLPPCKSPGGDCLPSKFEAFLALLAPRLLQKYKETLRNDVLPPSLRESIIITLLKPDKPPECPDS